MVNFSYGTELPIIMYLPTYYLFIIYIYRVFIKSGNP
jgi:hypothetical protein